MCERAAKSVGHEETYATDLYDRDEIRTEVVRLSDAVASRLRTSGVAARTITVKVRDSSFRTVSRSKTVPRPIDTAAAIVAVADPLVESALPRAGVRLLGVSASKLTEPAEQLQLTGVAGGADPAAPWGDASRAIDRVRRRFGAAAIGPASSLAGKGLRMVQRGQRQWGPSADEEE